MLQKQFSELPNPPYLFSPIVLIFATFALSFSMQYIRGFFPCGSSGKEPACNVGDLGSIPGLGRFPGDGKSYPL